MSEAEIQPTVGGQSSPTAKPRVAAQVVGSNGENAAKPKVSVKSSKLPKGERKASKDVEVGASIAVYTIKIFEGKVISNVPHNGDRKITLAPNFIAVNEIAASQEQKPVKILANGSIEIVFSESQRLPLVGLAPETKKKVIGQPIEQRQELLRELVESLPPAQRKSFLEEEVRNYKQKGSS